LGFTLYSTLCVVSGAPRVRRERWLQVLDGMRRQRGIRTCSTRRPRRPQFRRGAFVVGGKQSRGIIASRESGLSAAPKSSRRPRFERRRLRGTAVATPSPPAGGGGVGPPADCEAGERWRHVWCARQNRLPLFAVLRLDARAKCARGSSTVGCCVWAFGTVGRTRSSSGDSGPHRSACTAHLGASGGLNSFAGASPPRRRIVGAAATRLPRTIHRCGGGRRASTETAAELVLLLRGGHRL